MAKSFDITTKTINIAYTPNGGSIVVRYMTGANPDTCSEFDLFNDTTGIVTYAKGSSDTATNWTNRATLTYNDYAHTF